MGFSGIDFPEIDAYYSKMEKTGSELKVWRIGVLPITGFALMAYGSTVEPFRAANVLSRRRLYEVINIAPSLAQVASSGAASITPQATIKQPLTLDYLFVVAGGNPMVFKDRDIFAFLGRMSRFGARLGGVSAGRGGAGGEPRRRFRAHRDRACEASCPSGDAAASDRRATQIHPGLRRGMRAARRGDRAAVRWHVPKHGDAHS